MKLKKISIDGFKALRETMIEPGIVNVLIGENGSGKTSMLEAIGLLSAAINERVDESSLSIRGVRLAKLLKIGTVFQECGFPADWVVFPIYEL
jgi:predicted ATPase